MPVGILGKFKLPILTEFPDIVSTEDMQQLEKLQIVEKPVKVVAYEEFADRYSHPFFFGQLGCLFNGMDARALAIRWWLQCQESLRKLDMDEPLLNRLIAYVTKTLAADAVATFEQSQAISYYQSWRTTTAHSFPLMLETPSQLPLLKQRWQELDESGRIRYMTRLCIETLQLEGVFFLTDIAVKDIVSRGIDDACVAPTPSSPIQHEATIKDILRDTLAAYQYFASDMLHDRLTRSRICMLHAILMKTCRFGRNDEVIATGETRTTTGTTVIIGGKRPIEFCPYHLVDAELDTICDLVQDRLLDVRDPLMLASWIHLVLVRCHPFDDGNGRISRILASLPLALLGLPPVAVLQVRAATYYDAVNTAYDGNFDLLAQQMLECTNDILTDVQLLSCQEC